MLRFLDVFFSAVALFVLSPLLIIVILTLRLTGEKEVFFVQSRIGKNGREFGLLKFATMLKNSPNIGTGTVTLKSDPRVLPVGRILRKTKVNELPQLINVIAGDMSIVGPRPQTMRCFSAFPLASQQIIIQVRPGLTGVGSIIFRNEENMLTGDSDPNNFYDHVIMPYKGKIEEWYVENESIDLYLKVILLTAYILLRPNVISVRKMFRNLPNPPTKLAGFIY